eukprot:scaffold40180_cov32-Tisochrysis_lutea.AAC.1
MVAGSMSGHPTVKSFFSLYSVARRARQGRTGIFRNRRPKWFCFQSCRPRRLRPELAASACLLLPQQRLHRAPTPPLQAAQGRSGIPLLGPAGRGEFPCGQKAQNIRARNPRLASAGVRPRPPLHDPALRSRRFPADCGSTL